MHSNDCRYCGVYEGRISPRPRYDESSAPGGGFTFGFEKPQSCDSDRLTAFLLRMVDLVCHVAAEVWTDMLITRCVDSKLRFLMLASFRSSNRHIPPTMAVQTTVRAVFIFHSQSYGVKTEGMPCLLLPGFAH